MQQSLRVYYDTLFKKYSVNFYAYGMQKSARMYVSCTGPEKNSRGRGRGPRNNFVFGGLVIEISLQCM